MKFKSDITYINLFSLLLLCNKEKNTNWELANVKLKGSKELFDLTQGSDEEVPINNGKEANVNAENGQRAMKTSSAQAEFNPKMTITIFY